MSRNGSGTYNRAVAPYVAGTTITAATVNSEMDDIATALTQSLSRDGQSPPTANIPMGNFRITDLANAVASTDAAPLGQVVAKAGDTMTGAFGVIAGTAAAPGVFVSGDTNTGFFQAAAAPDTLSVSIGGTELARFGAGGFMRLADGTAAAPAYSFSGDDNTGFMRVAADVIGVVTGGTIRGTIDSPGNVVFGAATNFVLDQAGAARPFLIQSGSNSTTLGGSTNALVVSNSDTTTNNSSQLNFAAITGANANQYTSAIIAGIHGARTNGQYHAGALAFLVAPGSNVAPIERMRIPATGPVTVDGRALQIQRGTEQATTSGAQIDFTSIPAGVRWITVAFDGVSFTGADAASIQLGTSGGIETTGYVGQIGIAAGASAGSNLAPTGAAQVIYNGTAAADNCSGLIQIVNQSGNKWLISGNITRNGTVPQIYVMEAAKTLSGVLDRIRFKVDGASSFDAGSINILWGFGA